MWIARNSSNWKGKVQVQKDMRLRSINPYLSMIGTTCQQKLLMLRQFPQFKKELDSHWSKDQERYGVLKAKALSYFSKNTIIAAPYSYPLIAAYWFLLCRLNLWHRVTKYNKNSSGRTTKTEVPNFSLVWHLQILYNRNKLTQWDVNLVNNFLNYRCNRCHLQIRNVTVDLYTCIYIS